MQEASHIRVPETTTTFTITVPYESKAWWFFNIEEAFVKSLPQEHRQVECYRSFTSYARTAQVRRLVTWPDVLICRTPAEALEIRALLVEYSGSALEISEPLSGFREHFPQRVQAAGIHALHGASGASAYGHVVLEIEPDPSLEDVVFECRVDEETIPEHFLPTIASAMREAVFRGGPRGYPLSGFRAALIGGRYHPVDAKHSAYRSATLLALWDAFQHIDTWLVAVIP